MGHCAQGISRQWCRIPAFCALFSTCFFLSPLCLSLSLSLSPLSLSLSLFPSFWMYREYPGCYASRRCRGEPESAIHWSVGGGEWPAPPIVVGVPVTEAPGEGLGSSDGHAGDGAKSTGVVEQGSTGRASDSLPRHCEGLPPVPAKWLPASSRANSLTWLNC